MPASQPQSARAPSKEKAAAERKEVRSVCMRYKMCAVLLTRAVLHTTQHQTPHHTPHNTAPHQEEERRVAELDNWERQKREHDVCHCDTPHTTPHALTIACIPAFLALTCMG